MATRLRTQTNPFQENRRTSVLNSAPQQRSAGLGTVPLAAAGEAARPQTQLGQQVPLAQPMQQRAQPVPVNAVQQQTGVPVGIDQAALASGQEKLRNLQPPAPGVPVQPGGQTTGGIPTGAVSADGIATAGPRATAALARQQTDAALAQRGEPGSRGEGLEQTINDIATAQERQLRETNLEAGERGIIRPFVQGLEGDIRGAAAEQAAPLQRELQGIREEEERQRQEEDRQFQRNMQERQFALQESNVRSQIAARGRASAAAAAGGDVAAQLEAAGADAGNSTKLQVLLEGAKIPAGIRSNIGDVLSVITNTEALAENNPEGKFPGLGKRLFGARLLPGRFRPEQAIPNRQSVEAINLLTQRWASGAALTEAQTKQVEKLVPDRNDTDRQVRQKTDGLVDFMMRDVQGKLQAAGVFGFEPTSSNLFSGVASSTVQATGAAQSFEPELIDALNTLSQADIQALIDEGSLTLQEAIANGLIQ